MQRKGMTRRSILVIKAFSVVCGGQMMLSSSCSRPPMPFELGRLGL